MTIHRPPMPRPPQWQPDDCGCGDGWSNIQQCWNEIEQFKLLLADVISSMGSIPLTGVTDGSDVKPGQVGEFLVNELYDPNWSVPAGQTVNKTITALTVPPGDWDVMAQFNIWGMLVSGAWMILRPIPAGMTTSTVPGDATSPLDAYLETSSGNALTQFSVSGTRARLNNSVSTPLSFQLGMFNTTATAVTGNTTFWITARRVR